jgi:hypothetical protein
MCLTLILTKLARSGVPGERHACVAGRIDVLLIDFLSGGLEVALNPVESAGADQRD